MLEEESARTFEESTGSQLPRHDEGTIFVKADNNKPNPLIDEFNKK